MALDDWEKDREPAYVRAADRLAPARQDGAEARMQAVADALWEELGPPGRGPISWVGFYVPAPEGASLILGPRRDGPACSPIGMHGACGRCFRNRRPLVVTDVARLGAGYIACDPRDRSEVVVPVMAPGARGGCTGVLDVDSHRAGAFSVDDARALLRLLEKAGLGQVMGQNLDDIEVV
ncbi:MAG TPA: GAF domain-containing protein [Phycisphaerales bacterium]|nr:GAF domain-containing protein [Phycisphaerales bacterium]